jgi:hypothetical protein
MNTTQLTLWTSLLATVLGSTSQPQGEKEREKKKSSSSITRFFEDERERLTREVEGSWTLFAYTDPRDLEQDDAASGFATFHAGFLTLTLAMDTLDQNLFGYGEFLVVDTAVYRYRFDEMANLQLAAVMSFTNQTDDGQMERGRPGRLVEYYTRLDDSVLELRTPDGVVFSFRKVTAGEFPAAAIRGLDRRRSGTDQWQNEDERER